MSNVHKSERKRASARYLIPDTFTRTVNRLAQRGLIMGRTLCGCRLGSSMAPAIILSVGVGLTSCYGRYCSQQSKVRFVASLRIYRPENIVYLLMTKDEITLWSFLSGIRVYRHNSLFAGATNPSRNRNCVYFHISYPSLLSLSWLHTVIVVIVFITIFSTATKFINKRIRLFCVYCFLS